MHHLRVAFNFFLVGKTLVQNEMVVALKGMTIDACIVIAMVGNELLESDGRLRKVLNVEGYILYETARSDRPHTTNARENS